MEPEMDTERVVASMYATEPETNDDDYPGGWFGASWGAAVCEESRHKSTPVGQPCMDCVVPITADDQGLILPYVTADRGMVLTAYHKACFLRGLGS